MHLDRRLLGWGLFFILLGGVPLLARAGVLTDDLVGRWPSLWPLFLIAMGLGLILSRTPLDWIGGAVLAVTLGLMGGGALATGFSGFSGFPGFSGCGSGGGTPFAAKTGDIGTDGQVIVEFSCGELEATAVDGSSWNLSGTDRDGDGPGISVDGSRVEIRSRPEDGFFNFVEGRSHWNLQVPRSPTLAFGVTLNAGEGTVDLSGANLSSTNFTVNAGSLDLALAATERLGSVNGTVNAGSALLNLPNRAMSVNLSLNAGSIEMCLPTGTPITVQWSGALGSNDLDDAGLTEVEDNRWQTPGFDAGQPHVSLNVSANAGSFDLQLGGTCGA